LTFFKFYGIILWNEKKGDEMKRFLLPIGFLCLIGVFVFALVRTSRGRVPSLAVPKTSQAVVARGLSFGCTSGDIGGPSGSLIPYQDYVVYCPYCSGGTPECSTTGKGFCQTVEEPPGELMDAGMYSWRVPDYKCGATGQWMSPSCNDASSGEFWGLIQYIEEQLRYLFSGETLIPMVNGMLCGQGAHAASSSRVSGVDACAAADLCVFDAGKGRFKNAGDCTTEAPTAVDGCYGRIRDGNNTTGVQNPTLTYYTQSGGTNTWTTQGDGWILYANRGEAVVWFNPSEQKIEALIAIWGDTQAPRVPPLPPVGDVNGTNNGPDQNDGGTVNAYLWRRNPDRICIEAMAKLCMNRGNPCPGTGGGCGAVLDTRASLNMYADAIVIKTKLNILQDPNNPNIIDLCPAYTLDANGRPVPSPDTTWLELVDKDIEPDITASVKAAASLINCNCTVEPDDSFSDQDLNASLAGLIFDVLNKQLHGTCKGNTSLCVPFQSQPPPFNCDGSNCSTNPGDERCDPCDNDCDNTGGIGGDINESLKNETNAYCDYCDLPEEKADNPNGGSTAGWNYCVRGVPPPTGTGGECSVGLFPMDLNNLLGNLLFGMDLPLSTNDPQYSPVAPDYGSINLLGVKYDLGCYPQGFDIRSYGCYSTIDTAIYPRWSEYQLCADIAEVGEYPNKTNPPPFYFLPPTAGSAYEVVSEPYAWDAPDATWTDVTASADGSGATITLPWSFPFFTGSYTSLKVFRNGFATFYPSWATNSGPPATIPDPTDPDNVIAPFWRVWKGKEDSYYTLYYTGAYSFSSGATAYILRYSRTNPNSGGEACTGSSGGCNCGTANIADGTNDTSGGDIDTVGNIQLNIASYYYFDTQWTSTSLIDISVNGFISPSITPGAKCSSTSANTINVLCADLTPTYDQPYQQCTCNPCSGCGDTTCRECRKIAYGGGVAGFANPSGGPFVATWNGEVLDTCTNTTTCSDVTTCCCDTGTTCSSGTGCCTGGSSNDYCQTGTQSTWCVNNSNPCPGTYWGGTCANTACADQNYAQVRLVDNGDTDEIWFQYGAIPNSPGSLRFNSPDGTKYVEQAISANTEYRFRRQLPNQHYVRYKNFGDRFVISWDDYHVPLSGNVLNPTIQYVKFQLVLYPSGDIVFRYNTVAGTSGAVFGIENSDGSVGTSISAPSSSTAYRFKRTPAPPYHFMIGLNQDLATEIAYSLYVSSLACNVFDKNSIICDLFGFFGGGSSEECPFMKVSTQRSITPGLKIADPDCYVELRMRPAGGPSIRTGAAPYSVTWPAGYPTQTTSGIYDGALFVPNFLYEVRAPLDDGIPGVCSNPPVTVLVYDTNGWGGLDLEYINLYHPMFPDKPGYIHIFLDIGFHLNEIRYSAEYGLSPVEQKDSVNQFIGLLTNIYLATLMNFRFQLPFISDPSDPLTIKFNAARPSIVGAEEPSPDAIDYLPGAWPENTAGDYLVIYGILEGKLNLYPLIQSLGLFSPPETRTLEEIEKLYPETFVRLPQWGEDELSTQIELSPYDTARLFEDHTISFNISSYSQDTPSGLMRYTYRLNNGLWSVPKGTSSIKLSYLPDGYYKLEVAAIGNKQRMDSTPAVVRFVVDRTPPRVEPLEKKTVVRDEVYKFPVFIDDNMTKRENLKTRFRVDNGEWVDFDPRLKYLAIPLKTKGLHDIEIEAYDEAGNRGFYKQGIFRSEKERGFSCGVVASAIKGYAGFFLATLLSIGIPLLFLIVIKVRLKRKGWNNKEGI
jgi:hypothetical protein